VTANTTGLSWVDSVVSLSMTATRLEDAIWGNVVKGVLRSCAVM
jgi:hypothetical protein